MGIRNYCVGCSRYEPYYRKGIYAFDKQDFGYCMEAHKTVDQYDICESYSEEYHCPLHVSALQNKLDETLKLFTELKQIVVEGYEEEKKYHEAQWAELRARRKECKK